MVKVAAIYIRRDNWEYYNNLIKRLRERKLSVVDYIRELEKENEENKKKN